MKNRDDILQLVIFVVYDQWTVFIFVTFEFSNQTEFRKNTLVFTVSTVQVSYKNFTPTLVDDLVNSPAASLRSTLDRVAPLKKKISTMHKRVL